MRGKSAEVDCSQNFLDRKTYLQRGSTQGNRHKSGKRKNQIKESIGNALSGSVHGEDDVGPTMPPRRSQSGSAINNKSGTGSFLSGKRRDKVKESLGNSLSGSLNAENDVAPTMPPRRSLSGNAIGGKSGSKTKKASKSSKKSSRTFDDPFIDALLGSSFSSEVPRVQKKKEKGSEKKSRTLWQSMGLEKIRKDKSSNAKKGNKTKGISSKLPIQKSTSLPALDDGKVPRRKSMSSFGVARIPRNRSSDHVTSVSQKTIDHAGPHMDSAAPRRQMERRSTMDHAGPRMTRRDYQPGPDMDSAAPRRQMERRSTMDHAGPRMTRRDYQPGSPALRRRSMDHYGTRAGGDESQPKSPTSSSTKTDPTADCNSRSPSSFSDKGSVMSVPIGASKSDITVVFQNGDALESASDTAKEAFDSFYGLDLDARLEAELRDETSLASQSSKVSKALSEPDIPSPLKKLEAKRRIRRTRSKGGLDSGSYHGTTHTSRRIANSSFPNKLRSRDRTSSFSKPGGANIPPPPPMSAPVNLRKVSGGASLLPETLMKGSRSDTRLIEYPYSTSAALDSSNQDWASLDMDSALSGAPSAAKPHSQASLSDPVAMSRVVGENLILLGADLIARGHGIQVSTKTDDDSVGEFGEEEEMELEVELGVGTSLEQQITKIRTENGVKLPMKPSSSRSSDDEIQASNRTLLSLSSENESTKPSSLHSFDCSHDDSWSKLEFDLVDIPEGQSKPSVQTKKKKVPRTRSADDLRSMKQSTKNRKKTIKTKKSSAN